MDLRPIILTGAHIRLEPVRAGDHDEMREALDRDAENWAIMPASAQGEHWPAYWQAMIGTAGRIALAVRDIGSGALAGTSSFYAIEPAHASLEIGYTWFRPEFRGGSTTSAGYVNAEAKLLMLGHAFDCGAERVGFRIDARNARSQAAVAKLGAVKEGVIRSHLTTWTGHRRDTALFSILRSEWPATRARLEERLAAFA